MSKKILIITGDPISVNSEIIYKCWIKLNKSIRKNIFFISNYKLLNDQFKKLGYSIKTDKIKNLNEYKPSCNFKIIDVEIKFNKPFHIKKEQISKFITNSLNLGHELAKKNKILGIINCPINKKFLKFKNFGVTEYLAKKCKIKNNSEVMLITNGVLSVSPVTTHINIKKVPNKISKNIIINKIKTINLWFKKKFGRNPRIAILGLNPHNAEYKNSSEEKRIIIPSIKFLKNLKMNVKGPFVSDTFFIKNYKNFDIIVGMYHDQVLTPFKALFNFEAVNLTLGLDYLRASPDHGVAVDLIGKNKANFKSLLKCINFINKFNK